MRSNMGLLWRRDLLSTPFQRSRVLGHSISIVVYIPRRRYRKKTTLMGNVTVMPSGVGHLCVVHSVYCSKSGATVTKQKIPFLSHAHTHCNV